MAKFATAPPVLTVPQKTPCVPRIQGVFLFKVWYNINAEDNRNNREQTAVIDACVLSKHTIVDDGGLLLRRIMKEIQLTQGKVAFISDHRYERVSQHKWHASYRKGRWYAASRAKLGQKRIYLHRFLMDATDDVMVDHKDGDGLNCTDENLRICTNAKNLQNRGKQVNNKTGYKGVYWSKREKRYKVHIQANRKVFYIGVFKDPVEAARAYDAAAKELHGEFAKLNFPD